LNIEKLQADEPFPNVRQNFVAAFVLAATTMAPQPPQPHNFTFCEVSLEPIRIICFFLSIFLSTV
jgi:hypothetical protein